MSLTETEILSQLSTVLDEEQIILIQDTQANNGGSLLRTLEFLFPDELPELWTRLSALTGRRIYMAGRDIETLEEPVFNGERWEPMLRRDMALKHQALVQRTEGLILCLVSVNPWLDLNEPDLLQRSHQISLTGQGQLRASVLPPALYRQCISLAYPSGLYGAFSLCERLSIAGLTSLSLLEPFAGREQQAVEAGIITEHDYAACLAQDLGLPLYNYSKPVVDWNILPIQLIEQLQIVPLRDHNGQIDVATAIAPDKNLTDQLRRQSGRAIQYEITTPSVIRALLAQRTTQHG